MSVENVLKLIKDEEVRYVDLRFTDTKGKDQHVTIPHHQMDADMFEDGKMFDGSSISGWKGIHESDMILMPDATTAVMDPFFEEKTLIIRCDIVEPSTGQGYGRDPRSIAKRAEDYLKASAWAIPPTSARNPNSSFSTTYAGRRRCAAASTRLIPPRATGPPRSRWKAVTRVIVRASRADISRFLRSIPRRTYVRKCARCWNRWAFPWKCTITRSRLPASVKSAPVSTPW